MVKREGGRGGGVVIATSCYLLWTIVEYRLCWIMINKQWLLENTFIWYLSIILEWILLKIVCSINFFFINTTYMYVFIWKLIIFFFSFKRSFISKWGIRRENKKKPNWLWKKPARQPIVKKMETDLNKLPSPMGILLRWTTSWKKYLIRIRTDTKWEISTDLYLRFRCNDVNVNLICHFN